MNGRTLSTRDGKEWAAALPAHRSVFGSLGFARVLEQQGDECALITVVGEGIELAYPVALHRLPAALGASRRRDVSSPPFTGPLLRTPLDPDRSARAGSVLDERIAALGVVTEFAHVHPWRPGREVVRDGLAEGREIVYVDVTLDDDQLDRSYTRSCRKNLRRARQRGVCIREADGDADMAAFHSIYSTTMARRGALPRYHYPLEYFLRLRDELRDNARFALAEVDGDVVAATLYLHDDTDVYSYLGGSDLRQQEARPTNLLVHETVLWARRRGKQRLVLGGGYQPNDGIARFKASFSPLRTRLPVVRRVHDRATYDALMRRWRSLHPAATSDFFPAYRSGKLTVDEARTDS
jgi:hypothetical protein